MVQSARMSFPQTFSRLVVPLYRTLTLESKTYREKAHYCQEASGTREPLTSPMVSESQTQTTLMEALPKVIVKPQLRPVSVPSDQCQFIVFDLETTGLTLDSDICQIAAMRADPRGAESVWSTYLLPVRSIEKSAQKITGLSTECYHGQKYLFFHGEPVEAQPYEEGIRSFYAYLQEQLRPMKHTVLVGYGSERLDAPVLINNFGRYGITRRDLGGIIAGFSDALDIIRKMQAEDHPSMVKDGLPPVSVSLSGIYRHLFSTYLTGAHNAIADTRALHRILFQSRLNISPSQLLNYSSTVCSVYDMTQYSTGYLSNLNTMKGKLFNNREPKLFVTRYIAAKMARSGICYEDLARIYREYGPNGITVLLTSPCNGSNHRVTNDKKIIDDVIQHFQSRHDNLQW